MVKYQKQLKSEDRKKEYHPHPYDRPENYQASSQQASFNPTDGKKTVEEWVNMTDTDRMSYMQMVRYVCQLLLEYVTNFLVILGYQWYQCLPTR